jgi:hypothetical protein
MSSSRLATDNTDPSQLEQIRHWLNLIYNKCKRSRPLRYFVSAVSGVGLTLVVVTASGATFGIAAPITIILGITAFMGGSFYQNQSILARPEVEDIQQRTRLLQSDVREQGIDLAELKAELQETRNAIATLSTTAATHLHLTSLLCKEEKDRNECEKLAKGLEKIFTEYDLKKGEDKKHSPSSLRVGSKPWSALDDKESVEDFFANIVDNEDHDDDTDDDQKHLLTTPTSYASVDDARSNEILQRPATPPVASLHFSPDGPIAPRSPTHRPAPAATEEDDDEVNRLLEADFSKLRL